MLGMSKVICFKQGFYSPMRSSEKFLEFAMFFGEQMASQPCVFRKVGMTSL